MRSDPIATWVGPPLVIGDALSAPVRCEQVRCVESGCGHGLGIVLGTAKGLGPRRPGRSLRRFATLPQPRGGLSGPGGRHVYVVRS